MIAFLCTIWIQLCSSYLLLCFNNEWNRYDIIKAIKNNFCINHHNTIYEHKTILQTLCVMHVFIDGVVVVNAKITFYYFDDIISISFQYFIHCWNIKDDKNCKIVIKWCTAMLSLIKIRIFCKLSSMNIRYTPKFYIFLLTSLTEKWGCSHGWI